MHAHPRPRPATLLALLAIALAPAAGCIEPGAAATADLPLAPLADATVEPGATLALSLDAPLFWELGTVAGASDPLCYLRDLDGEPNVAFTLAVPEGAAELRVAAEKTTTAPCLRMKLVDPRGANVLPRDGVFPHTEPVTMFSHEIIVEGPAAGEWTVGLFLDGATIDVRLRALARAELPAAPAADALLLPDLRPSPPFELKFQLPTVGDPGPTPVPADGPLSCEPDEVVQNGAPVPCLRFSFAAGNVGEGPFQLHFSPLAPPGLPRPAVEWIFRGDGSHDEVPAGQFILHRIHGHYHWEDAYSADLLAVGEDGSLMPVTSGFKRTGCTGDIMLAGWRDVLDSQPLMSAGTSNACLGSPVAPTAASPDEVLRLEDEAIGLTPGWMDVYPWSLADNYVPFPSGDGVYVLRFTVDPKDFAIEADESNNVAYALLRASGTEIEVLERGFGMDPTDPARVVVDLPWLT